MLQSLRIRQMVIVEDLTVEFGPGLNLLTGETGAGKSILVDAVGLIVGQRGERTLVRSGADKAIIEGLFDVSHDEPFKSWARKSGLEEIADDGLLVVRRELQAQGGGRVWLNGSPSTLGVLREAGSRVLELHGQHEQQSLLSPEYHLDLLDNFAGLQARRHEVARAHGIVAARRERLEELQGQASERQARLEELQATITEIESIRPRPGELREIDRERSLLRNAARMTELLDEVVRLLYDGEPDAGSLASAAARQAAELAKLDPSLEELASRLDAAAVDLQDAGEAFRDYREAADFNPARLEELEARRVEIERLCLRYGTDEQMVLARLEEARREMSALRGIDGELERARGLVGEAEAGYVRVARRLGRERRAAARRLAPEVEAQFAQLALAKARIKVEFGPPTGPEVKPERGAAIPLHARGAERAGLLLAANPGEPFRPLAKVASGGELSRVMLALHAVVEDAGQQRVLVFDEVDSGVSGAVADAVGSRLACLARKHQVLCVTHLPQVAAYADRHYGVRKQVESGRTRALIHDLSGSRRVEELARMLGGKRPTPTSRRHASELLTAAGRVSPAADEP